MSQQYERAKEQITKILIEEYCKQNPGVRESEVIFKCQNGQLIFSDMAAVLAEMKVRKNFQQALEHSGKMYASLAAHENERWQECIEATSHIRMMVDCLHSSPFHHYSPLEWHEMHNYLNQQEQRCAKATVRLEESRKKIQKVKEEGVHLTTPRGRLLIIEHLNWVIDQLKVIHRVYRKEVEIGDVFAKKAKVFIDVKFPQVQKHAGDFQINIDDLNRVYKSLSGDKTKSLPLENVARLNLKMLLQTRKTLLDRLEDMNSHLRERREQFQEIWSAIAHIVKVTEKLEAMNQMDEEAPPAPEDAAPENPEDMTPMQRMARYTQSLRNMISKRRKH